MLYYTIKLRDVINNNCIGYINFIYYNQTNKIYISYLNVFNNYKGKGYGTLLILFSIRFIIENIHNSYFIKEIKLDDCSDYSCSTNSIYYKLGFRNYSQRNEELFVKFFNNNQNKNEIKFKTIYDLYDYIYINNLIKLNTINYNSLIFEIDIYDTKTNDLIKVKNINFDLDKKINKNSRITRRMSKL